MVVLDDGKYTAHPSNNAALFTVVDITAADDMAADLFLEPSVVLTAADRVTFHLGRAFDMPVCKIMVVVGVKILAERDTGTFAVADFAVLDNPAFGPVGTDHAVLISGRRCPGCRRLVDVEAADGDIADAGFGGHKTFPADVDFNIFLVRIFALKIRVDDRFTAVLFGVPFKHRSFRLPGAGIHFALDAGVQTFRLIHHLIIEIDGAGMFAASGEIPVAVDIGRIGVIIAKNRVINPADPYISLIRRPALDLFSAGNHSAQRLGAAVGNPCIFGTGVFGVYILAVDARRNQDFIAGLCDFGGIVDMLKGHLLGAVAIAAGFRVDINFHIHPPFLLFRK